jgi:hypothetical protein
MYTIRFNAVLQQWVLLGEPMPETMQVREQQLQAVTPDLPQWRILPHPRHPFQVDAPKTGKHHADLVTAEHAPVGEYDLVVYTGDLPILRWTNTEWAQWLQVIASRLRTHERQMRSGHVRCVLHTKGASSLGVGYVRAADCMVLSHKLAGMYEPLQRELAKKLLERERLFTVADTAHAAVYVCSAPSQVAEVWVLPHTEHATLSDERAETIAHVAGNLTRTLSKLHAEYPERQWVIQVHTAMHAAHTAAQWWVQIYADTSGSLDQPLTALAAPERLVTLLRHS